MGFFAKLEDMAWLAMHNLWRQRMRNAIMAGVLALGIAAYMVVMPIMDALAERAVARTTTFYMPCDLVLAMTHVVTYEEISEIDPSQSKVEMICPAGPSGQRLPWRFMKGFRGVEFATIEQVYSPAGTIQVLYGSPTQSWFSKSVRVVSGLAPSSQSEIIVPSWFARKAGVTLGSNLALVFPNAPLHQFNEKTFTVTGIFDTDFRMADLPIIWAPEVHDHQLTDLGELDQRGSSAQILAMFDFGGARLDVNSVKRDLAMYFSQPQTGGGYSMNARYRVRFMEGFTPDTPEVMARMLAADVQMPAINALFLAFIFVAVGLFTVMLLSFFDRRRDIAIMKTVGIGNNDVASVIMFEIVIVTLAGVLAGAAVSNSLVKSLSGSTWAGVLTLKWSYIFGGAIVGFAVMGLSAMFPVSLARVATVNQLLYDQKIYLFHRRIMRTVKGQGFGRPGARGRT